MFDGAADVWLIDTADDAVLGIGRYCRGEKLVALFNFAEDARIICVDEIGDYADLITGEPAEKEAVSVPGGGYRWLLCEFEENASDDRDDGGKTDEQQAL